MTESSLLGFTQNLKTFEIVFPQLKHRKRYVVSLTNLWYFC